MEGATLTPSRYLHAAHQTKKSMLNTVTEPQRFRIKHDNQRRVFCRRQGHRRPQCTSGTHHTRHHSSSSYVCMTEPHNSLGACCVRVRLKDNGQGASACIMWVYGAPRTPLLPSHTRAGGVRRGRHSRLGPATSLGPTCYYVVLATCTCYRRTWSSTAGACKYLEG